ncbi:MAG TPA: ABC transporter permease [Methanotrichaceae archaeon]|nr:ABC transporter permease [Methanotrichaceae archaeon]HQF17298.1 ABC transporter permease [Methanotrichaceae archaeon]HQI91871.1 ABC transporter permease [Methanotrichaceae archaeon]HQJ29201.1 ABC transporter permease [Methanotrichaceae archaeon]
MNFLTLAAKNLLRRRGRTVLTVLGVAIAISVLFSLLALNSGYERELDKEVNSMGVHVLAVPKGCPYEAASLIIHGGVIPKYLSAGDVENVSRIDGVELATPILMHQFMKKDDKTGIYTPHIIYGIEIEDMLRLKPWWKVEGRLFADNETRVMLVGRDLADKENLSVGQVLPVGPDKEDFAIVGILDRTGDQDDQFHFFPLAEAQRVFHKEGKITTIAVKLRDVTQISAVSEEMEKVPDIQVVTMTQVMGTIMNLAGSARSLLLTVMAVALIISAFGIINTLLMSVNERTREFGMMKAVGASGTDIARIVLAETVFITIAGGAVGIISAIIGSSLIEGFVKGMLPYSPRGSLISISPELIGFALAFSVILGLACGIYPAIKSSRLTPMEAIREGLQ